MNRVVDVVRVQLVNWRGILAWPLGILALTLVINLVIFGALSDDVPPNGRVTGSLVSIYIVMFVAHLQTITQVFPFALGLSVTRRAFYAGTTLLVVAQGLLLGLLLLLLELVERSTDGWGIGLRYIGLPFLVQDNLMLQWLVYAVPFLAFSAIGVCFGVVFKRWGQSGVYVVTIAVVLALAGFAAVVSRQGWWPAVGTFFTDQSTFALLAGYPLVIAVVLGAGGWLVIRRATP
jgi:hypothetical protein